MIIYEKYCFYLEASLKYTPNTTLPCFLLLFFIEQFPLFITNIFLSNKMRLFLKYHNQITQSQSRLITNSTLYKISLVKYFHNFLEMKSLPQNTIKLIINIAILLLLIYFISFVFSSHDSISPTSSQLKNKQKCSDTIKYSFSTQLSKCSVYLFDLFIFRILFFWLIYSCISSTLNYFYLEKNNYYIALIGFFIAVLYGTITLIYFNLNYFFIQLNPSKHEYPYDSFSSKFESLIALCKTLIALSVNIVYLNEMKLFQETSLWLWAFVLEKCIVIIYCLLIILNLTINKEYIIFYRNTNMNTIRIYYLFLYAVFFLFGIAFDMNGYKNLLIPGYISLLLLTIIIVKCIDKLQMRNVLLCKNIWNKLLWLLNYYMLSQEKKAFEIIKQVQINHLNSCYKEETTCLLCNEFLHSNSTANKTDIINTILFLYESRKKVKVIENSSSNKKTIIKTFLNIYLSKQNIFKLNILFLRTIPKLMKINPILAMNFIIYFKLLLSNSLTKVEQIQSILMLDYQRDKLKVFIETYKEVINSSDKNYEDLINKITKLYKLKKEIKNLLRNKREDFVEYQFIIMKYIYETMLNKKLKNKNNNSVFNFAFYEEFLQYHYHNDNHFILNYDLNKRDFEVIKTGKEYSDFQNKRFISIFPFTEIALQHLITCLESQISFYLDQNDQHKSKTTNTSEENNTNKVVLFEYPAKMSTHLNFVCSFQMTLEIFPTINLKNFYIISFYQNNYNSIILTLCDYSHNKEKIVSFSPTLEPFFVITPNIINELNYYGKFIYFNYIFSISSDKIDDETKDYLQINYKRYFTILNNLMKFYFEIEISITEEEQIKLKDNLIKAYKISKEKPNINKLTLLKVNEIFFPKNKNLSIKIYYTQTQPKHKKTTIIKQNSCFNYFTSNEALNKMNNNLTHPTKGHENNNAYDSNHQYINTTKYFASHSSMTRISTSSEKQTGPSGQLEFINKFKRNMKVKKNQYKNFSIITFIILIYNIVLILLTIIFLIMEIKTNNIFQNSFTFLQLWNKYTKMLMSTILTMFSTICPAKNNENECEMIFQGYSEEYEINAQTQEQFDILTFLSKQMEVKMETFTSILHTIKERIFHSINYKVVSISEEEITFITIFNNLGEYDIIRTQIGFMSSLDIYLSLLNNIMTTQNFDSIPIQIISVRNQRTLIDLSNLIIQVGDEKVLDAYAILLNYRVIMAKNTKLTTQVITEVKNDIDDCEFIGEFFLMFLIANQFVLFLICLFVIRLFRKILNKYCTETYETFENILLINGLREKSTLMSDLLMFYKDTPNNYSKAYDKLKFTIKKAMRTPENDVNDSNSQSIRAASSLDQLEPTLSDHLEVKSKRAPIIKTMSLFQNNQNMYNGNYNSNNNKYFYHPFLELLNPSIRLIYGIFIIYFIFAILYLVLFRDTISSYKRVILIFSDNANVDFNIYSAAAILQVMLLTNQTEYEMLDPSEQTEDGIGDGYITSRFKQTFNLLFNIEKAEGPHFKEITSLANMIDLSCQNYLNVIDDEYITKIQEIYSNGNDSEHKTINVINNLGLICERYEYLSHSHDKNMIKQVLYRIFDIKDKIIFTFDELYKINTSKEIFDMYLILLTVYEPIRNYESTVIYNDFIKGITNRNNMIIYSYLVVNILFEFVIFSY